MDRRKLLNYARETYQTLPEYPWPESPEYAVLRHRDNHKWYALIMRISGDKLGLSPELVDVVNFKADPEAIDILRASPGFFPAYHMNKEHWVTALLDGSVASDQLQPLIDSSFALTK